MKTLLINASVSRGLAYGLDDGMPQGLMDYLGGYQPLGICYIASVLQQNGFPEVQIIDAEAEDLTCAEVARRVETIRPDLIGLSCNSFSFLYALDLARLIKEISPAPLVVGGPHVDIYPEEVMSHRCFDLGAIGEGELSFLELARRCSAGARRGLPGGLSDVAGLVWRDGERVAVNLPAPVIENLDSLPHPARHLLNIDNYKQNYLPNPFISVLTTRGCPHRCSYCCRPSWTRRARSHSAAYVVDEIERCIVDFNAYSFQFFDDTFTIDRRRVLEICRLIRERQLGIQFLALTRVDRADREIIEALRSAGCRCISFGVESGDDEMLQLMGKGYRVEVVERTFEICREVGIDIVAYYLIGHPQETHRSILRTIRSIQKSTPNWFKANILIPYPASRLYDELVAAGEIPDMWREMTLTGTAFETPSICRALGRKQLERYRNLINIMPYIRLRSNLLHFYRLANPRNVLWSVSWIRRCLRNIVLGS